MELDGKHTERIARCLDGEPVELTADEQSAVEEIRRTDAALGAMLLDVQPPRRVMELTRRRMVAELARPRHRTKWVVWPGVAASVAAVVLMAFTFWWRESPPLAKTTVDVALEGLIADYYSAAEQSQDADVGLVDREIEKLDADMLSLISVESVEDELDALQQELEMFRVYEANGSPGES